VTFRSGSRLGPYEILSPLGAGGMGEVYRAKDPRLGRDVAVKVLPASFSNDPDRLRRFEQEGPAAPSSGSRFRDSRPKDVRVYLRAHPFGPLPRRGTCPAGKRNLYSSGWSDPSRIDSGKSSAKRYAG
jgi:serine/threonine protein kinase